LRHQRSRKASSSFGKSASPGSQRSTTSALNSARAAASPGAARSRRSAATHRSGPSPAWKFRSIDIATSRRERAHAPDGETRRVRPRDHFRRAS